MSASDPSSTEPQTADAATPFEEQPRDLPAPRQGCSRMALAGCAVVVLLIGLGVLTLMMKAGDIVDWSLTQIRGEIERALPADLPAAQADRLGRAFDAASDRLGSGELDALAFQDLQKQLLVFARLGRTPTSEEIDELTVALERFAGLDVEPSDPAAADPESDPEQLGGPPPPPEGG